MFIAKLIFFDNYKYLAEVPIVAGTPITFQSCCETVNKILNWLFLKYDCYNYTKRVYTETL